jgi:transposase-like protein
VDDGTREIVRLYRGGLPVRAIGRRLGLHHMAVTIALHRAGVPRDAPQSRGGGTGAKLTPARVRAIRRRAAAGESQAALARAFGVEPGTVWRIVHRVTWRDLTEED